MSKKSIILLVISIIILILAIVFATWSFKNTVPTPKLANEDNIIQKQEEVENQDIVTNEEVSKTKDFDATYTDFVAEDKNGNQIKLSDYKGSPVVVLFWDEENEDSVEMLKRMNEQYKTYKDAIKFIAISSNIEKNLDLTNIEVPIYYDETKEIINLYNVIEFPTIIYINQYNEVFNSKTGLSTIDALKANLDILSENY